MVELKQSSVATSEEAEKRHAAAKGTKARTPNPSESEREPGVFNLGTGLGE